MSHHRVQVDLPRRSLLAALILLSLCACTRAESWEDICPHTICEGVADERFIDNPLSCAAFFACRNGRAYAGECPGGTWFNYAAQKCDAPWNVPCDAEISEVVELECLGEEPPHYVISCRNNSLHALAHPYDCSVFYLCVNGQPIQRRCAPGLEFNRDLQQCMDPVDAKCGRQLCPSYNIPLTFLPSNRSCAEFSICYDGVPIPHSCARGLYWDQENQWCTHPDNVVCEIEEGGSGDGSGEIPEGSGESGSGDGGSGEIPEGSGESGSGDGGSGEIPEGSGESGSGDGGSGEIPEGSGEWGSGESSGDRPIIEFQCTPTSPLFNPDPNDCTRYIICDLNGNALSLACGDGLYFDMVTSVCKPYDQAKCYPGTIL